MFTGIIEEIGTVEQIRHGQNSAVLKIHGEKVLEETGIGDSIAVNGICLTVTSLLPGGFTADVMHETLNRSALADLTPGSHVNLERAMRADGRFGGHIVAGHADGVGKIVRIWQDDTAVWFTIEAETKIMNCLVEKGSVTIDGISLTIASVTQTNFSISAIPHTVKQTILQERNVGDLVNLETDIIGKYVEKLLHPARNQPETSKITRDFLSLHGF